MILREESVYIRTYTYRMISYRTNGLGIAFITENTKMLHSGVVHQILSFKMTAEYGYASCAELRFVHLATFKFNF